MKMTTPVQERILRRNCCADCGTGVGEHGADECAHCGGTSVSAPRFRKLLKLNVPQFVAQHTLAERIGRTFLPVFKNPTYMMARRYRKFLNTIITNALASRYDAGVAARPGVDIDFRVKDMVAIGANDINLKMSEEVFDEMARGNLGTPVVLTAMDVWFRVAALQVYDLWEQRTIATGWMILMAAICGYDGVRTVAPVFEAVIGYDEREGCGRSSNLFTASAVLMLSEAEGLRRWAEFVLKMQDCLDDYYGGKFTSMTLCALHTSQSLCSGGRLGGETADDVLAAATADLSWMDDADEDDSDDGIPTQAEIGELQREQSNPFEMEQSVDGWIRPYVGPWDPARGGSRL